MHSPWKLVTILLVWTALCSPLTANPQEEWRWYSPAGSYPEIQTSLADGKVLATTFEATTVELQLVDQQLLEQFSRHYIDIRDINGDDIIDIGVMEGADISGSTKCYKGYEFDQQQLKFSTTSSATYCLDGNVD